MKKILFLAVILFSSLSFAQRYPPSGGGVDSVNGLGGAINIVGGPGISVTTSSPNITISSLLDFNTPFTFAGFDGTGTLNPIPGWTFNANGEAIAYLPTVGSANLTQLLLGVNISTPLTGGSEGIIISQTLSSTENYHSSYNSESTFNSGYNNSGAIGTYQDQNSFASGASAADYDVFNATVNFAGAITGEIDAFSDGNTMASTATTPNYDSAHFSPTLNGAITNQYNGIEMSPSSTATIAEITGINMNLANISSGAVQKAGLSINDGALEVSSNYDTSILPASPGEFQMNIVGGEFHVAAGFPMTNSFGFGVNLASEAFFEDTMGPDPTGLGIGFSSVLAGGQLAVLSGLTEPNYNMLAVGAGVPSQSTGGTITDLAVIKVLGLLPSGGTVNATNIYGVYISPNLHNSATNTWGFYVADPTADNWLAKDLVVGGVTGKSATDSALDVTGYVDGSQNVSIEQLSFVNPSGQTVNNVNGLNISIDLQSGSTNNGAVTAINVDVGQEAPVNNSNSIALFNVAGNFTSTVQAVSGYTFAPVFGNGANVNSSLVSFNEDAQFGSGSTIQNVNPFVSGTDFMAGSTLNGNFVGLQVSPAFDGTAPNSSFTGAAYSPELSQPFTSLVGSIFNPTLNSGANLAGGISGYIDGTVMAAGSTTLQYVSFLANPTAQGTLLTAFSTYQSAPNVASALTVDVNNYSDQGTVGSGASAVNYRSTQSVSSFSAGSTINTFLFADVEPSFNGTVNNGFIGVNIQPNGTSALPAAQGLVINYQGMSPYPTQAWGLYISDPSADNWLAKDVLVGGSTGTSADATIILNANGTENVLSLLDQFGNNMISFNPANTGAQIGFFGATPVVQQSGDVGAALVNYGLIINPSYTPSEISGAGPNGNVLTSVGGVWTSAPPSGSAANTLCDLSVGPAQPYTTIGAAITAATAGQSICIQTGTYVENVTVSKQLNIYGSGRGVVISGFLEAATGGDYSLIQQLKVTSGITIDSGVTDVQILSFWNAAGQVVTDNGTGSFVQGMQE